MRRGVLRTALAAVAALAWAASAGAHGGAAIDRDPCVQKIGSRSVHFTVYQPQQNPAAEYCRDVPKATSSIVVFDLVDPALRTVPFDLRVVRDGADGEPLVHVPARLYGSGIINAEVTFGEPGRYTAVLTPGEGAPVVFPLRVEMGFSPLVWLLPVIGAAPAVYWWSQRRSGTPPASSDERPSLALVR